LTAPIDIHKYPEEFLQILVGLLRAPPGRIGFDETVFWGKDGRKHLLVAWKGNSEAEVVLNQLIFISDALHGRGTTVWAASMYVPSPESCQPTLPREIVVKDSWIDPLQKFTEGGILAKLNEAGVEGVPRLIHEQQVQGPHPSIPNFNVNQSTHIIRTLLSQVNTHNYHIRVLSRLLTEPLGQEIMNFSSLAKLLVVFIDYVLSEF